MSQSEPYRERRRRDHRRRAMLQRAVLAAVLLFLFFFCLFFILQRTHRSTGGEEEPSAAVSAASEPSQSAEETPPVSGTDSEGGEETPEELTDEEKLAAILADDGTVYPERLQEQVQTFAETIDYVYNYPIYSTQGPQEIDLSAEAAQDTVPLLLQWDSRWGYESYGSGLIGYNGCGPTCLSMVALYLTDDAEATPLAVARYADSAGYYVTGSGTAWTLLTEGCEHFGLKAEEISLTETLLKRALDAGKPIICNVGPGDFTPGGHFIVITGYTAEGFTVNDPNSPVNSGKIWTFETLAPQIQGLWAYSLK